MLSEILPWLLLIEILGWSTFGFFSILFSTWPDRGFGLSKIAGLLLLALVTWVLGYLKFPFNETLGWSVFLGLVVIGGSFWIKRKAQLLQFLKKERSVLIWQEVLYLTVFLFFVIVRGYNAEIYGAEKFMDFAFLNSLFRANVLPPPDPWMSGFSLNYYHFGYATWAMLTKMVSLPTAVTYNLAVSIIPALAASGAFSVGLKISGKRWLAFLGSLGLVFLGNLAGSVQIFAGKGGAYNYWEPTRVIDGTINEFPFFTFIWADLHPHLMAIPNFVLSIGILTALYFEAISRKIWVYVVSLGICLALAYSTSGWDLAPLLIMSVLIFSLKIKEWGAKKTFALGGAAFVCALLVSLPFYFSFKMTGINVGVTTHPSALDQFFLVMGSWLVLILLILIMPVKDAICKLPRWEYLLMLLGGVIAVAAFSKNFTLGLLLLFDAGIILSLWVRREKRFSWAMILTAFAMLTLAEIIFIDNVYGPALERINTVFKFHLHAWLLFGLALPFALAEVMAIMKVNKLLGGTVVAFLIFIAGLCLVYPVNATFERARHFSEKFSLDGNLYLEKENKGDRALIKYINENIIGQPVILEATKDPYRYWSRISANTGLPTVLGWANHENLWRRDKASHGEIQRRVAAVQSIYNGSEAEARRILSEFRVKYVVVGETERATYPKADFDKFEKLGKVIFNQEGTKLYQLSFEVD